MTAPSLGSPRTQIGVALLLLAVISIPALQRCGSDSGITPVADRGGPRELAFTLLEGSTWRLSDHRGEVVAVNLWATWCGPCRSETPMLERFDVDPKAKGFHVIGVSLDVGPDKAELVRRFRETYHVTYPLAFPDAMSQIESGLEGIPTTLLFDRHGRAAKVYVGELRERSLRADVTRLLGEP